MKVVIEDVEYRSWLSPQHRCWEVKLTRHLSDPRQECGVDQTSERMTLLSVGEYEIGDELGAAALEHGGVEGEIGGGETVVVAVGEGEKGEVREGGFVGDATVHVDGGGNSDVCAQTNETLCELKCRVYVALCWVHHDEEAVAEHGA